MRIVLLGDFSEGLDEGFKNTSYYLAKWLQASGDQVVRLNVKRIGQLDRWQSMRSLSPEIIHTIAQPTNGSLIFTHFLRHFWSNTRTVISALRPDNYFQSGRVSSFQRALIQRTRPDLILVQDSEAERRFKELGCAVAQLHGGVDLERFSPSSPESKRALRRKYGLDVDQPLVLHVGHLRDERNLESLELLPGSRIQVVIVGSLYMQVAQSLISRLESMGIKIFAGYYPDVENFYKLADCYVFPVHPGNSLSMPLSVLEAMACNLRVVTARFPGLVDAFQEGQGLKFVTQPDRETILSQVVDTLSTSTLPSTRQMVRAYSWQAVTGKLRQYYRGFSAI